MSIETSYQHIEKPIDAPARLKRLPRIRVAQIAMDYLAHGWSADEMCRQHPYLLPAEAHAAMAYYFDHQQEIDLEIREELQVNDASQRQETGTEHVEPGLAYRHVPFQIVGTRRVRYTRVEALKPRQIVFDEEVE